MENELIVMLESRTKIQDFNKHSLELASTLHNFKEFEEINVGEVCVSGVSLSNIINILEAGVIVFSYYNVDFSDEDLLSSTFSRLNDIRNVVSSIVNTKFNDMTIRLNFEHPNTIREIEQKLHILKRVIAKTKIGINSVSMKYGEEIDGPYKVLEVVVSY